jgi:tetratricopeptide (TPR) repeat protein
MIETKDAKRSLLIPKWSSYLDSSQKDNSFPRLEAFEINTKTKKAFAEDRRDFEDDPSVTKACDLLHSSLVLNEPEIAREAASFIIEQPRVPKTTTELAKMVLGKKDYNAKRRLPKDDIASVRSTLRRQTRNSLLWTELARLHTKKGRTDKAERCILTAIELASPNRFVVRSAVRFFIHVDQPDKAFALATKAAKASNDPWLISTQINSSILAEKTPPKMRSFDPDSIPPSLRFHYSELIASLGVAELRFGSDKRAKKLFKNAWIDPSESVIANAEWVIRNRFPHLEKDAHIDFTKSAEASSWHSYFALNLSQALDYAREWGLEEPYSTHPFSCGSSIACSASNYELGIHFAKEGLLANPGDSMLINNLAYSLLKNGTIRDAERVLSKFPKNLADLERVYLLATTGLYYFKTGRAEIGRKFYIDAYELSQAKGQHQVAAKALLCLAEAEKEIYSDKAKEAIARALAESINIDEPSIILLRQALQQSLSGDLN